LDDDNTINLGPKLKLVHLADPFLSSQIRNLFILKLKYGD